MSELKHQFMNKYSNELIAIFNKYDMDKSVCVDILVAWCRNLNNPDKLYVYDFVGSEKVDIEDLKRDIKMLEDNFIIPKLFK